MRLASKARASCWVDSKSTVIGDLLPFLSINVGADHLFRYRPATHSQVATRPEMPAPELAPQSRKLLKHDARADPVEPMHDWPARWVGSSSRRLVVRTPRLRGEGQPQSSDSREKRIRRRVRVSYLKWAHYGAPGAGPGSGPRGDSTTCRQKSRPRTSTQNPNRT